MNIIRIVPQTIDIVWYEVYTMSMNYKYLVPFGADRGERVVRNQTCCFTGHRIIPRDQLNVVQERLKNAILSSIHAGYRYFGAGGALGFDTLAAQQVLALKKVYPNIKLILVLPCKSQARGWHQDDIDVYERIKASADKVVYTSENYFSGCMHKRNRHLVDNSSLCICYLTENSGGTHYTVRYAEQNALDIVNVAVNG